MSLTRNKIRQIIRNNPYPKDPSIQQWMEKILEEVADEVEEPLSKVATKEDMDRRFDLVDKRFEMILREMDKRFEAMDKRFETMEKRFEDLQHNFNRMFVWISIAIALLGILTTVFGLLK